METKFTKIKINMKIQKLINIILKKGHKIPYKISQDTKSMTEIKINFLVKVKS